MAKNVSYLLRPGETHRESARRCREDRRSSRPLLREQPYQRPSLMGLRAALHRHISSMRRDINILNGEEFRLANDALDARLSEITVTFTCTNVLVVTVLQPTELQVLVLYILELTRKYFKIAQIPQIYCCIVLHLSCDACSSSVHVRNGIKTARSRVGLRYTGLTLELVLLLDSIHQWTPVRGDARTADC